MIIAFETASTDPSVAVAAPDGSPIAVSGWTSDRRQGHETLPRLLDLLAEHGQALSQASAVAVGLGPGSFTGLRVGMSLAKGIAVALGRPLVGVASLAAWLEAEPDAAAALARAGAHEAYLLLRDAARPTLVDHDALPPGVRSSVVVAPEELAGALALERGRPPHRAAAAVAAAAARRLVDDPAGDDLARLEPTYLRAPRGLGQVPHVEIG